MVAGVHSALAAKYLFEWRSIRFWDDPSRQLAEVRPRQRGPAVPCSGKPLPLDEVTLLKSTNEAAVELLFAMAKGDAEDRAWEEIAARIMRFCSAQDPGRAAWAKYPDAEDVLHDAMAELLPLLSPSDWGDERIASLSRLELIRNQAVEMIADADPLTVCLRLFALAMAIDDTFVADAARRYPSHRFLHLRTGDLIITAQPLQVPRRGWSTRTAENFRRGFTSTPSMRILPEANFSVTVDHGAWEYLDALFIDADNTLRPLHAAAIEHHFGLNEFAIGFQFAIPGFGGDRELDELEQSMAEVCIESGDESRVVTGKFTNRGPRCPDESQLRAATIISEAVANGANVVLVPEYGLSATEELVRELKALKLTGPVLIAAGVRTDGVAADESCSACQLWLSMPERSSESGLLAFEMGTKALAADFKPRFPLAPQVTFELKERVTGGEIVVLRSPHAAVVSIICRDMMDQDLAMTLATLSPTLLLVPAMTAKTATMGALIESVVMQTQAHSVLANGPATWGEPRSRNSAGRAEAIFCRPAAAGGRVAAPAAGEVPPDGELGYWRFQFWSDVAPIWVPSGYQVAGSP